MYRLKQNNLGNAISSVVLMIVVLGLQNTFGAESENGQPQHNQKHLTAGGAAKKWDFGYPVGNGNMGAINIGSYPAETVFINDDRIWKGTTLHKLTPGERKKGMQEAGSLAMQGKFKEAEKIYSATKNRGNGIASFQGLGKLSITYLGNSESPKTRRELDLVTGINTTTWNFSKGSLTQTLLASYPDKCILIRLETTLPTGLNCKFEMSRPKGVTKNFAANATIGFEGQTANNGIKFKAACRIIPEKGAALTVEGNAIVLKGGRSAVLVICSATDYNRSNPRSRQPQKLESLMPRLDKTAAIDWSKLKLNAVNDHQELMQQCDIDLGATPPEISAKTTAERLNLVRKGGSDPDLLENFFQLGRHLLISSSRPGTLPPNLQGLWEPGMHAAWNGDFHLNINVQMNMWPANLTGLGECNEEISYN